MPTDEDQQVVNFWISILNRILEPHFTSDLNGKVYSRLQYLRLGNQIGVIVVNVNLWTGAEAYKPSVSKHHKRGTEDILSRCNKRDVFLRAQLSNSTIEPTISPYQ